MEGLRQVPAVLKTSVVPDPGEDFWRQQRYAIGRAIRNLPEPSAHRAPDLWLAGLTPRAWRYPLAAAAALVLATGVYRFAERQRAQAPSDIGQTAVAALDPRSLGSLDEFMEVLVPQDDGLAQSPPEDDTLLAALQLEDSPASTFLPEPPQATELSDDELDGISGLVGGVV